MKDPALIKLVTGEQLVARVQDNNDGTVTLFDPLLVERMAGWRGTQMVVSDWLPFAKEAFITISTDKIVAFKYGLEDNAITNYEQFVNKTVEPLDHHEEYTEEEIKEALDVLPEILHRMQSNTTIH